MAAPAQAAVGDTLVAWLEVENGVISGGPGLNQGDHGQFSGTGSYTFHEAGMRSTMSFTAPTMGTYPVWIRYSAGGLGNAEDDVLRKRGLLVNGGSRQRLDFPATYVNGEPDQHDGWERWSWVRSALAAFVSDTSTGGPATADSTPDAHARPDPDTRSGRHGAAEREAHGQAGTRRGEGGEGQAARRRLRRGHHAVRLTPLLAMPRSAAARTFERSAHSPRRSS